MSSSNDYENGDRSKYFEYKVPGDDLLPQIPESLMVLRERKENWYKEIEQFSAKVGFNILTDTFDHLPDIEEKKSEYYQSVFRDALDLLYTQVLFLSDLQSFYIKLTKNNKKDNYETAVNDELNKVHFILLCDLEYYKKNFDKDFFPKKITDLGIKF